MSSLYGQMASRARASTSPWSTTVWTGATRTSWTMSITSRNHDYTGNNDVHHPFEHHGTAVSGVIAARDNGIGVHGVASQATIYGYNYLAAEPTDAQRADAMARNSVTTAVSNNSWGPTDGPGLGKANAFWEQAIKSGLNQGFGGKGVLYVWAGGNGHLEGDNSNLDELANFYAVTAACAVNDADKRSRLLRAGSQPLDMRSLQ